jgi:rubrerythrin
MEARLRDPKDPRQSEKWYRCLRCGFRQRGGQLCPLCEVRMVEER